MSLMKDFFKAEMKLIQLKTGIRQLENIMQLPNWEKQLEQLLELMVNETNRPPFDLIGVDVKQRVISNAIVEDGEFIGLNPKFVRKALNTWWHFNKDKYYEKAMAANQPHNETAEPLKGEERMKWLQMWQDSLSGAEWRPTPAMTKKEIEILGQERPVGPVYQLSHEEMAIQAREQRERIRACRIRVIKDRHPDLTDEEVEERLKQLES